MKCKHSRSTKPRVDTIKLWNHAFEAQEHVPAEYNEAKNITNLTPKPQH